MLFVSLKQLSVAVQEYLDKSQGVIDAHPDYLDRVETAKNQWSSKSQIFFGADKEIRCSLKESCSGLGRCHYCEDSLATDVEHVYPKDLYPEKTFRWENYLYACSTCNSAYKRDFFAIIDDSGDVVDVTRPRNAPVVPPVSGEAAFINPRVEDPLEFFDLDFSTGAFTVLSTDPRRSKKASYTRDLLKLNRDILKKARVVSYRGFVSRLVNYVSNRGEVVNDALFEVLKSDILSLPHRTVWRMILRCHDVEQDLVKLFSDAPELKTIL
ncbi:hypothetical protein K9F62_02180 [Desulfovibrio sp. JY]|nr:hypothetical protein K9F62_02180 [Desulfovibrio sp. JY]